MKKSKKIASACLATLMLLNYSASTLNVLASEKGNEYTKNQISQENIEKIAEKYIHYDQASKLFQVDINNLKNHLSQDQLDTILNQIDDTNKRIESALNMQNNEISVHVVDTNKNTISIKESTVKGRGKNDIEFHWNYARIFIDAGNVSLALQVGFAIGAVYAPAKIIQAVCAALGIVSSNVQHGIWFDYNYFIGILCGNFGLQ